MKQTIPRLLMPKKVSRAGAWHVWLTYDGFEPERIAWVKEDQEAYSFAFKLWLFAGKPCTVELTKERGGVVTQRKLVASGSCADVIPERGQVIAEHLKAPAVVDTDSGDDGLYEAALLLAESATKHAASCKSSEHPSVDHCGGVEACGLSVCANQEREDGATLTELPKLVGVVGGIGKQEGVTRGGHVESAPQRAAAPSKSPASSLLNQATCVTVDRMKVSNGRRLSVYLAGDNIEAIYKFCDSAGLPRNLSAGVRKLAELSPILNAIIRVGE